MFRLHLELHNGWLGLSFSSTIRYTLEYKSSEEFKQAFSDNCSLRRQTPKQQPHTHTRTHIQTAFYSLHFQTALPIKTAYFYRKITHNLTSFAFLRLCSCIHWKSIWKWLYLFLLSQLRHYQFIL